MKKQERLIITFSGTSKEFKKQLKLWCAETDTSMNKTIVGLIEKHLKKNKLAQSMKEWKESQK